MFNDKIKSLAWGSPGANDDRDYYYHFVPTILRVQYVQ